MAHQEVCSKCVGTGYVECPECEGSGEVMRRFCTMSALMPCTTCQKKGRVECPECKGKGELVLPDIQ